MKVNRTTAWVVVLSMGGALVAGCGKSGTDEVELAQVSGKVELDGQPLAEAQVNFLAQKYAGVATTGADGTYQLEAQTGENQVYIRKFTGVPPDFDATMIDAASDAPGRAGGPKQVLPARYSHPEKTELKFNVPEEGTTEANFKLTSK